MAGEYGELVRRAQADADPAHRQAAMTEISVIAQMVAVDTGPADAAAGIVLARLYPQTSPGPEDPAGAAGPGDPGTLSA